MGEILSNSEASIEKKEKVYPSVSEYLSAFEESPQFNEALTQREEKLRAERSDINLSKDDLAGGMRMVPAYRKALIDFYWAGNKLPVDSNAYNDDARGAIKEYWDYIKSMPDHINLLRATARDKDDEEIKLFRMEKTRDKFHTFAGLSLLGEGISLKNGQKITCDEISPEDESAMPLESYSVLGRALVSIITEENALDIVDPNREEKKTTATLNFLNSCHYSAGHWLAKGEK